MLVKLIFPAGRTSGEGLLLLDGLPALANLLRHVLYFHDRVRLDDPQEVLFEEGVV